MAVPASGVAKQFFFNRFKNTHLSFTQYIGFSYLLLPKCYSYATSCGISVTDTVAICTPQGAIFSTKFFSTRARKKKKQQLKNKMTQRRRKRWKEASALYPYSQLLLYEPDPNISRNTWTIPSFCYFQQALCQNRENLPFPVLYFYPLTDKKVRKTKIKIEKKSQHY